MELRLSIPILALTLLLGSVPAADSTAAVLDTTRNNTLGDISIFGDNALGSIFILWDNIDIEVNIKKSIQEKAFATDDFFMQNIDREQFEQERILQLFQDDKRQYFKLFPDDSTAEEEE